MKRPFDIQILSRGINTEGLSIDYKRVISRIVRYWYVLAISILVSLLAGYLQDRYAVRIYPVSATVLVKQQEETNNAAFLYSNSIISGYNNYLNETYIIKSFPIIQDVVNDLNLEVSFIQEGKVKNTEIYGMPIKVRLLEKNGSYGASLKFEVTSDTTFSIRGMEVGADPKLFAFGDSVRYGHHHFYISKDAGQPLHPFLHIPFIITFHSPQSIASAYTGKVGVTWAEEGAGILYLSVNGANPEREMDFLNGLIKKYQLYDLKKKNETAEGAIRFINNQLKDISDSMHVYELQLQRFKATTGFQKTGDETERLFTKIDGLTEQKAALALQDYYFNYLLKSINGQRGLDLIVLPSSAGVNDPTITTMVNKMYDLQLDLKLYQSKEQSSNPLYQSGIAKMEAIKKDLVTSIHSLQATSKIKSDQLQSQIDELQKQILVLPQMQSQFLTIQRSYSLLENIYTFLMQKLSEASISKASSVSNISVVNPPMIGGAISPNTSRIYTFSLAMGILIPIALFVLFEVLNQTIQSKEDIEKITKIPFIGGIGHNDSVNVLIVNESPLSAIAESFRAVRSNLNYFTQNQTGKVFMVTSSISGEGKTFSTINLATVFAMSGRKTLIIGADMRRPKIFQDFNLDNRVGLSGYLSEINTFEEIIQRTGIKNLDLISGGPVPPNPSELLLMGRFELLIGEALKLYDYIIVDTPPLAIVTDAFVMAKFVDHTIFVVRQNYTHRTFLRDIESYYATGKLEKISIVLNDIQKTGLGYGYGYGYSYGYGYTKNKSGYGYYS